jgi:mannose-6-phosphate isomerase
MAMLYPFKMQPVMHARVWGGRRLGSMLHKTLPDDQPYGESWEVHDTSRIANGQFADRTLASLIANYGADILGSANPPEEGMPLLLKFLDTQQWLSIQVHPDDELARTLEGDPRGKNEAWVILHAEAGAQIIAGMQPGSTTEQLTEAIQQGTLEQHMVYYQPKAGDVLYVEAGTIHALGPGLLVYEIQQSSDVTYRLYDWNRLGIDGHPRPLHIEKGLRVSRLDKQLQPAQPQGTALLQTPYFALHRYFLTPQQSHTFPTTGRFHILTCVEGAAAVISQSTLVSMAAGDTVLIPAGLPEFTLSGDGLVLHSHQPIRA